MVILTAAGQIEFRHRGCGYDGGTFVTTDENKKKALEQTKAFRDGLITIIEQKELGTPAKVEAKKEEQKVELTELESIVTVNEAASYIKKVFAEKGMVAPTLRSKKDVLATAQTLGIVFPNIK